MSQHVQPTTRLIGINLLRQNEDYPSAGADVAVDASVSEPDPTVSNEAPQI